MRQGKLTLTVVDQVGKPLSGMEVSYQQINHDFMFGAVGEPYYYSELQKAGINTAVLYLDWRWLLPGQGEYTLEFANAWLGIEELHNSGIKLKDKQSFFMDDNLPPYYKGIPHQPMWGATTFLSPPVNLPEGKVEVLVRARAHPEKNEYLRMVVGLGGEFSEVWTVSSTSSAWFDHTRSAPGEENLLTIRYPYDRRVSERIRVQGGPEGALKLYIHQVILKIGTTAPSWSPEDLSLVDG